MTDISKHPLLKACYEACLAVEKLGCGPEQTDAVSRVSDMMRPIEALVDERDSALKARDEAADQVVALREWIETTAQHPAFCGVNWSKAGSYAKDTCTCGKIEALFNTSALAAQRKREIQREACEEACEEAWERVRSTPSPDFIGYSIGASLTQMCYDGIRNAILNPEGPDANTEGA